MRAVWIARFVAMHAADAAFFEGRHTAIVVAGAHEYGDDFNRHIDDLLRLLSKIGVSVKGRVLFNVAQGAIAGIGNTQLP
jgi:hypothetical protein